MGIFDFMQDMDTHDLRKVATYDEGGVFVDTCRVSDSDEPYETAVAHPKYNGGEMIIVEMYDTKIKAQIGHDKWVTLMTAEQLPRTVSDVSTATVAKIYEAVCPDFRAPKEKGE